MIVSIDLETRSVVDLKAQGLHRYAAHPSTRIIMAAWAVDDGPVRQWDMRADLSYDLFELLDDPTVEFRAFNAPFEMQLLHHVWRVKIRPEQWTCTMAWAYSRAFTGGLAEVGAALGLPAELLKQPGGTQLIKLFSTPDYRAEDGFWSPADHPNDWRRFLDYNRQDVVAERAIANRLAPHPWTRQEREKWLWDRRVNERGLPVDTSFAIRAQDVMREYQDEYLDEISELTGVDNPNSRAQIMRWLETNGVRVPNLQGETIDQFLKDPLEDDRVLRVLALRKATSQAAVTKYKAVTDRETDGRLTETLQVWGAGRTGRWSGRAFQLQNLKRPPAGIDTEVVAESVLDGSFDALYGGLGALEVLGGSIRAVIKAGEGKRLVVSDLSSIESRIVGWMTDCRWINLQFAAGRDTYKAFGEMWLGIPYDQITKAQRNLCKPPFLGFAYRLGGKKLVDYAAGMGVEMDEDTCVSAINAARAACPEVVSAWSEMETMAAMVMDNNAVMERFYTIWRKEGEFMTIELPSGRKLWYHRPEMAWVDTPWGEKKYSFTYWGQDQVTKQWRRLTNHGGRFVEQITQGIGVDVLYFGMRRYDDDGGGTIVGHVHDEIIAEESAGAAKNMLGRMNRCLTWLIPWAPGLLLGSEGYISTRYRKG